MRDDAHSGKLRAKRENPCEAGRGCGDDGGNICMDAVVPFGGSYSSLTPVRARCVVVRYGKRVLLALSGSNRDEYIIGREREAFHGPFGRNMEAVGVHVGIARVTIRCNVAELGLQAFSVNSRAVWNAGIERVDHLDSECLTGLHAKGRAWDTAIESTGGDFGHIWG